MTTNRVGIDPELPDAPTEWELDKPWRGYPATGRPKQ